MSQIPQQNQLQQAGLQPTLYYSVATVDGKIEARLMTTKGHLFTVSAEQVFGRVSLAGLGRFLCIEAVDRYSQQILLDNLRPNPDFQFYIQVTHKNYGDLSAAAKIQKHFVTRHGRVHFLPHQSALRECDIISHMRQKMGFIDDNEFGERVKLSYTAPEAGVVNVIMEYTSRAGIPYTTRTSYQVTEEPTLFKVGDKVVMNFVDLEGEIQPTYPDEVKDAFIKLAELGTKVLAVAGNERIRIKWGWLDKPKFREAAHNAFATLIAQGIDLDTQKFNMQLTSKVSDSIGTIDGTCRFSIEDDIITADFVYGK